MPLSGTNRGEVQDSTGATTWASSPLSNFTAGSLAVFCASWDNAGASGADPYVSISDSHGNTWVRRQAALFDPGAARAGVAGAIFTCDQAVAPLTTASVITIDFGSTTVDEKAGTYTEIAPSAGTVGYVDSGVNAGADTGTPTVTTSSIANGNVVVGALHAEINRASLTGDADTTNGSWSTAQKHGLGVGAAAISVLSQFKVVTATATQTFNPTLTAADCILSWMQLREVSAAAWLPSRTSPSTVANLRR